MKNIISLSIGLLLFLNLISTAHAAPLLSADNIQDFMNAMRPLQELGKKYNIGDKEELPPASNDFTDFAPMSRALDDVKDNEAYDEFEAIILKAGFSSSEQWASVGDRIMRAYTATNIIREMTPEKKQKMLKSIEEVKKNAYLSSEIKQQLLKSLTQSITMSENLTKETKKDQDALKPYLTKLKRLFEEQ